jgi:Bacterial regulatory proteins, luxR family
MGLNQRRCRRSDGTPRGLNWQRLRSSQREGGQSRPTELVGESLWLMPKTVETHVRHILRKLNLPSDTQYSRRMFAVLA